ncbi:hypothetical protein PR002_g7390 [Phytophthora rubi]|uniref:Uncharacterized protein n=1 Tax=Phytophthora rubi TaxID=129364 RepID=A0A6A3MRU6_9STRA|nr:hypothetical protein PR002_g7390 [Phytophthora rubi]
MKSVDAHRRMKVFTNADAPEGVGLTPAGEGISVHPYNMIQLVGWFNKLEQQVQLAKSVVQVVIGKRGKWFDYKVGRMIKVQRGALKAGKLAENPFKTLDQEGEVAGLTAPRVPKIYLGICGEFGVATAIAVVTVADEGVLIEMKRALLIH